MNVLKVLNFLFVSCGNKIWQFGVKKLEKLKFSEIILYFLLLWFICVIVDEMWMKNFIYSIYLYEGMKKFFIKWYC